MILFFLLEQCISFKLHIIYMSKPFPQRLGEADEAVGLDIFNLVITNGYYCNNLTVDASLRVALFFPAAICQDQVTFAQPEALDCTNRHSATKRSLKLVLIFNMVFLKILR